MNKFLYVNECWYCIQGFCLTVCINVSEKCLVDYAFLYRIFKT